MFITNDPHRAQVFSEDQIRRMVRDEIETDEMHRAQAAEHDAQLGRVVEVMDVAAARRGTPIDDGRTGAPVIPALAEDVAFTLTWRGAFTDRDAGELLAKVAAALRQSHAGIAGALDSMAEAIHTGATRVG